MDDYGWMNEAQLRTELNRRGLIYHGAISGLRVRLERDDSLGPFRGFLGTMSDEDLRNLCRARIMPSTGNREELFERIEQYNKRKGVVQEAGKESGGWLNTGLPTPEDRLGPPGQGTIPGTQGSDVYHEPYAEYIKAYERDHGTTENALTLRYWRLCQNPGVPPEAL